MNEIWWTYYQAIDFLTANYACDSVMQANELLIDMVREGIIPARCDHGNACLPIQMQYEASAVRGLSMAEAA